MKHHLSGYLIKHHTIWQQVKFFEAC